MAKINLAPLFKCQKLYRVSIPKRTKIQWLSEEFDVFTLPSGLKPYLKQIRTSYQSYLNETREQKKKLAHEKAPEKIKVLLNQFRPGVPVYLNRIAALAEIPIEIAKAIILEILKYMPEVGEFLELEQVFIRKTEAEIQIDKLLDQFQEWG